jgi:DNA-binding response OmpR family regulator
MKSQSRILLIEDERPIRIALEICLKRENYRVMQTADGESGLQMAIKEQPDLVILDVGLPAIDGIEVCRRLREVNFDPPILMLTSRAMIEDRVVGLNAGADDYLAKPFEAREFLARVNALLRRRERTRLAHPVLRFGDVRIDLAQKMAIRGTAPLALTKTEFALLQLLAQNAGQPVSREKMLDVVWGYTRFPTTRTIDTHIWRLRKKIGDDGDTARWLKPVHGRGYCLMLPAEPAPDAGAKT